MNKLDKVFNDGRAFELEFQNMKAETLLKDEPVNTVTIINGKPTAVSRTEIRNELKAELREQWKNTKFKGRLSKRLKKAMGGGND